MKSGLISRRQILQGAGTLGLLAADGAPPAQLERPET